MKAKVKSTGEIIEVKPERDGFFIDETNSNPYKFEELEFIDDNTQQPMFASLLNNMFSNPFDNLKAMEERYAREYWTNKHCEIIMKLLELFKDTIRDDGQRISTALVYARAIINDIKAYERGEQVVNTGYESKTDNNGQQ